MQASSGPSEAGGGHASRRGHGPHLSISDPSHHVTEAIGHMYEDDYDKRDSRRLSYLSTNSESISILPPNLAGSETSPPSVPPKNHTGEASRGQVNGQSQSPTVGNRPFDMESSSPTSPGSTASPGSTDTATTSFPLNDIDYESNPAAVAQELNNLAAIRRMSMDVAATGDPDLPSFNSNAMPSLPPTPSADENDASRLFWVPARLHPELAPKEFKSFLESKSDHIKRKSGDFSLLSPDRCGSSGSLRRKKSTLSRQIDDSHGYTDGAERLERKRSQQSNKDSLSPNLVQLETMVDNSNTRSPSSSSLNDDVQNLSLAAEEDMPILPPAPPGHSLRRSTRTQYRKAGSLKKGDKLPYSKRLAKANEKSEDVPPIVSATGEPPILGLTRVSTDSNPSVTRAQALSKAAQATTPPPDTATSSASSSSSPPPIDPNGEQPGDSSAAEAAHSQSRSWHSRISSNGRSTLQTPSGEQQKIPEIVEPPPSEPKAPSSSNTQQNIPAVYHSEKDTPPAPPPKSASHDQSSTKRSLHRSHGKDNAPTLNEFASTPQALPGNTTRTDSLTFIPHLTEDRKSESKKSKKDSEGGRKSSWHWFLHPDEKDKDKDKEKKKEKDTEAKTLKSKIVDKVHETTLTSSLSDSNQRGRDSASMDRLDPKLEEERRKDSARRTSGEAKKEKESGLFSSIFGGGRKKSSESGHHKKNSLRAISPEPPVRILQPDVDYPWTRFSILEERAIYRMAHLKLANPRRGLYSQVLLSNFMYSYLAKVQQMHPHMMLATSPAQRQQKSREQSEEYQQYQRYQEEQDQRYADSSYDDPQMYEYGDDSHDHYGTNSRGSKQGYENGNAYGPGHYQYGHYGNDSHLDDDDDDDDMW
ncbi:hypothetical protein BDW42DRAFT_86921 [Aspergillus taichungensis]|uniref:Protein Zds1 C-terminal domain-containing protein n=1 Tax=Aspergillus taichungensis TaxID=482145 RepID=A0A2J5HX11_9EURO|nr:hypothetical protein BDW42DRAFT_86921 [Aspergillus taichungensis]